MDEVVSVFRSRGMKICTTRSWDFLGLTLASHGSEATPLQLAYGDDVIVAMLDSGFQTELMHAFFLRCNPSFVLYHYISK